MNQSYSLIRQRQQYALGYSTGQNDKDFYLQLFKIDNLQIVRAYGINIQQHWAKQCKNASNIKNWFDGTHDLVKYIKQGSQKMIRVWVEEGRIDILVQARKGKNKYVKIGQIQLQQVCVNKKMQLLWIIQQCNRSQCLNAQQIFYNVRNMYRIYMQFINMPETNKLQQQNEINLENILDIIQNLQKSLDLVQEYFETQTKRILGEFNTKINIINTKLENCQIKQNQASTQKLQYQMNKRQENTQQSIDNEIKYDITSQQNMGNEDISSYVNTSAAKFKYFKANQYQISVMKNPTQYSLMLCGHPIQTQKFKYSIKIIIMKKKIALGIAKASSAHKTRCSRRQQMIIYSNKSHFTFETNKANQGKHFKVGDTVSVCVNFREGLICWIANETMILFSQTIELLKNKQIVWMPYIEMVNQGDTIEWVPN